MVWNTCIILGYTIFNIINKIYDIYKNKSYGLFQVQCKIVEARDILQREKSPIRLVNLSPAGSPSRRASFFTNVNSPPFHSPVHNAA